MLQTSPLRCVHADDVGRFTRSKDRRVAAAVAHSMHNCPPLGARLMNKCLQIGIDLVQKDPHRDAH